MKVVVLGNATLSFFNPLTFSDQIAWTDPSTEVGALVGEPLTIDCSVKKSGSSEPQIQITNGDGEALDCMASTFTYTFSF